MITAEEGDRRVGRMLCGGNAPPVDSTTSPRMLHDQKSLNGESLVRVDGLS